MTLAPKTQPRPKGPLALALDAAQKGPVPKIAFFLSVWNSLLWSTALCNNKLKGLWKAFKGILKAYLMVFKLLV